MSAPAIEAHGLRKSYGRVTAVAALDLEVAAGTVLGLLGPNGAGKTTVIRMLSTIVPPDAGRFTVAGIGQDRPVEIRRRLGVLPENSGYPRGQTGAEWLAFHALLFGRSRADARATALALLAQVGLSDRASMLVSTYSQGMKQRLGIARALVNDPRVVFLDEPTLGLDPSGQRRTLDLVVRIARERGVTVVVSTHVLADVERACDQVIILKGGRIAAQGTVGEVSRRAAAPRRALLRLPPARIAQALAVLADGPVLAAARDAAGGEQDGEVELTMPPGVPPEEAAAEALARLLAAGVPVLAFALEEGRLSDAFLSITEGR